MEQLVAWDVSVLDWMAKHLDSALLDQLMPAVSLLGNHGMIWLLLAIILIALPKERARGIQLLLALGFSGALCNLILKNIVGRIRPFELVGGIELLVAMPTDYSFPSGHTSAAFAAAVVMYCNHWSGKHYLLALAILMGISRLYLYVHYPTDVLGGVLTGVVAGVAAYQCYKAFVSYREARKKKRGGV